MKRAILVALGVGALISSAAAIGIGMTGAASAERVTRATFDDGVEAIGAAREKSLARCDAVRGAEREVCRVEADAEAATRLADLEAVFHRTQETSRNAQKVKIDARYQVRRAQCQALGGYKRDRCYVSAHAERGRALLDVAAPYAVRYTH